MKDVQDRIVQFSNRYKLTNAETNEVLGTFDFDEVTGTVQQVGTEIDAELFDSIANDLAKRVRVDAKQNFSAEQQQTARDNIDAAATNGTYENFISGGVQCAQLYNNADLNDCVPENDKVFQAWVCAGVGISNTLSNTPFANFGRTFYLTAVKTWYNVQDKNKFRVVQTLYSVASFGVSLIWTRAIDGAGTLRWSDWKELVVADGSYPTLGAGYLANQNNLYIAANNVGWWKFGTIQNLNGSTDLSVILQVNGVHAMQGQPDTDVAGSGQLEIDVRVDSNTISSALLSCISGNIDPEMFCAVINGNIVNLYCNLNITYKNYKFTLLDIQRYNDTNLFNTSYFTFVNEYTALTSAPANAVYAVVRNIASYAESIPAASQTVLGGAKMWVSNGKLYIKTT